MVPTSEQKTTSDEEEQRQRRLQKQRERSRSSRANETEEQRQIRLEKQRERTRSNRISETEEQRQTRLENNRKKTRANRENETEEQQQIRLSHQKKRNKAYRIQNRLEKQKHNNVNMELENTDDPLSVCPPWPEPIPRDLKETRLQEFLQQMSMSILAEVTCAICNIRVSAKDSKKIPLSKIPNIHLLKVDEELDRVIKSSNKDLEITTGNI